MKNTNIVKLAGAAVASLALLAPSFAFAVDATAAVTAAADVKITTLTARQRTVGDKEIDRRVAALNALITRVATLKRLNPDAKASVNTSLSAQITGLNGLKSKIDADTDEATLKTDVKSVTDSYRIFALVMPQGRIVVLADTEVYIGDAFLLLGSKLDARIKVAQTAGKDVTALTTSLADLGTKANDAKVQAQAAITLIANLSPDNGDATVMASNNKALSEARAKLKVGRDDLIAARADAQKIITALKDMKLDASAGAGATTGTAQ